MAERGEAADIPIDVMEMVDEFVWTLEDTAAFVGGRIAAAIRRYLEVMMPPLAAALMKFTPGLRVLLAHARPHGRHGVPQVAGRAASSSTTSARTCCAPTCRSASAASARCWITPARWASTSSTAARVFGAHRTY